MSAVATLIRQPWLWAWLGALAVWLATAAFTGGRGSDQVLSAALTFGAFFVIGRKLGGPIGPIVVLLVINLVITFSVPGISWEGHVGGLVVGAALAAAYAYAPAAHRRLLHIGAPLVMLGLLTALVVLRTAELSAGVA